VEKVSINQGGSGQMDDKADPRKPRSEIRSICGKWIAVSFSVFVIYSMITLEIPELKLLAFFLSFTLALTFVHYPVYPKNPKNRFFLLMDFILVLLSFLVGLHIVIEYWDFIERVGIPTQWDMVFGFIALFLILEATRRAVGWPLLIIVLVFLLYTFVGHLLPLSLSHKGYGLERITTTFYMTQNGIFGVALKTMAYFIFLFIAFGAFFGMSGGTEFFINLATSMFGKLQGGPAKIAVVSSGMMGTISGSAVANTVTTGTFTIPLMKRIGFEPHVAGAVEATASTGGALMPPVMGAAAFVMAEYLRIPYLSICKAALLPAILYYLSIFSIVHFYSLKMKIQGLPKDEIPNIKNILRKEWIFILPLLVLIVTLILGYSPRLAVLYAIFATVLMSFFKKETRMTPSKCLQALAQSGFDSVMVSCACAAAGIVIGVVLLTGIGTKITDLVLQVSSGYLVIALPFTMVASILFGMGLPTVVCYVLLAATAAPSLVEMGVPPLAAHLYIFYFGMLCMVTPPVAFASYAGAAIAKADPMKTGFTAWRFALAGFLLPYMFVYNASLLLMGPPADIVLAVFTSIIGIICLASGIIGYLFKETKLLERLLLFAAAFLLIKPGILTDIIGLVCVGIVVFSQLRAKIFAFVQR
jgi:TRAP transporter 4TM/12TM fusion protein